MVKNKNALLFDIFQFRTILAPNITLKWKKTYIQQLQKIPPPPGGAFDLGLEKNYFLQITMGEMKKAPQAKIFVIGTIFTPKIAKKMQKNGQQKIPLI